MLRGSDEFPCILLSPLICRALAGSMLSFPSFLESPAFCFSESISLGFLFNYLIEPSSLNTFFPSTPSILEDSVTLFSAFLNLRFS